MMRSTRVLALAVVCVALLCTSSALAARGLRSNDDSRGRGRGGDDNGPQVPEALRAAMEACKEQAQTLCPRPDGPMGGSGAPMGGHGGEDAQAPAGGQEGHPEGEQGGPEGQGPPHPGRVVLCLLDHADKLTGECATEWDAIDLEDIEEMVEDAEGNLTPRAAFKRACDDDVRARCTGDDDRDDIIACLVRERDDLQEECALAVDIIVDFHEGGEGHDEGDEDGDEEGEYDEDMPPMAHGMSDAEFGVPSTMTYEEFSELDEREQREDDDGRRRRKPLAFIIGGIVAAVVVVAIVVVVVLRRRRRAAAARRVSMPRFEPMDSADMDDSSSMGGKDSADPPVDQSLVSVDVVRSTAGKV